MLIPYSFAARIFGAALDSPLWRRRVSQSPIRHSDREQEKEEEKKR
jgi:hypothetical protein